MLSLNIPYMERRALKGKANHKTKNCTSCQSLSVTSAASLPYVHTPYRLRLPSADAPLYCFDLMLFKNVDFIFEKNCETEKKQTKTLYNLLIYINADYKKDDFSCLRLYCTPAGTHLLRQHTFAANYQYILLKSPRLRVVSDPRNGLRHKQGLLTL